MSKSDHKYLSERIRDYTAEALSSYVAAGIISHDQAYQMEVSVSNAVLRALVDHEGLR